MQFNHYNTVGYAVIKRLLSQQFNALTGPAATGILLTTLFSAISTPVLMLTVNQVYGG